MSSKVIIVTGLPGVGKTTLARELAQRLHLPLIATDEVKELLFDHLGCKDREWSGVVGRTTYDLVQFFAERLLQDGASFVFESNFTPELADQRFLALHSKYGFDVFQVVCQADYAVRAARFKERWESGRRHRGHCDDQNIGKGDPAERSRPLNLPGKIVEVDTNDFAKVDTGEIIKKLGL